MMSKPDDDSTLDSIRLINLKQVADVANASTDTVNGWVRGKLFPPPIQARPGGRKLWKLSVVKAWVERRARARYVPPKPRGRLKRGTLPGGE